MSKYVISHGQLREISDEELMHWKYIRKEKKNGKWVYYYEGKDHTGSLGRGAKAWYAKETPGEYGTYTHKASGGRNITVKRQKSDKLFSNTSTISTSTGEKTVIENVGLLEQTAKSLSKTMNTQINKAGKWIKKLFYSPKKK